METFVDFVVMIGAFCFGAAVGMGLRKHKDRVIWGRRKADQKAPAGLTRDLIRGFLEPLPVESLIVTGREFPVRIQADFQRALDELLTGNAGLRHLCGIRKPLACEGISFSGLVLGGQDLAAREHRRRASGLPRPCAGVAAPALLSVAAVSLPFAESWFPEQPVRSASGRQFHAGSK